MNISDFPFENKWININGIKIHYVDEGKGLPVLFLHGNPAWSFLYRKIIDELRISFRCIAPDYPGFGFSENPKNYNYTPQEHAEIIKRFILKLKLENIILVLHDWGGPIGLSFATQYPDKISSLIILNSWCWKPDFYLKLFSFIMGGWAGKFLILNYNFFAKIIMPLAVFHKKNFPVKKYAERFPDKKSRKGIYIFARSIRKGSNWIESINKNLYKLKNVHVEIIWGMKDPAFGWEKYPNKWKNIFPNVKITRLKNASHYIQEDNPETIIKIIRKLKNKIQ